MADAQSTLGALQTISSILGVVKDAISVGQLIGENNKAPDETAKPGGLDTEFEFLLCRSEPSKLDNIARRKELK